MDKTNYSNCSNYNPSLLKTTTMDYGQDWLNSDAKSLRELGENEIKLRYLEKALKSQRRINQKVEISSNIVETNNEKYKYDKNALVSKKFPCKAEEYRYPNDGKEKPKSLYIRYSEEYGSKKPNELEMPGNI
jgi:hypothetical protein